jgi:DNA repair exonuclease SbcCD nuclease subunit
MREVRDAGINIYAIYGSHDFSPNETSIVDILASAGLFQKIVKGEVIDNKLKLKFVTDPNTKAQLIGISGRTLGLEREYYEILDRATLERKEGFKIFAFHTALDELKPSSLALMESTPLSYLPKGFDYYAGGHIHTKIEGAFREYGVIRYPGTLFGYNFRDLEQNAKGGETGFFIVTFDDRVKEVRHIATCVCEYVFSEYDVTSRNSVQANEMLIKEVGNLSVKGKLVLIRIRGELAGGKTGDINFNQLRSILRQNGAVYVNINRYALSSKEYQAIRVEGRDIQEVEEKLLRENVKAVKISEAELKGEKGIQNAIALLGVLRHPKKSTEKKMEYDARMVKQAVGKLKLTEAME